MTIDFDLPEELAALEVEVGRFADRELRPKMREFEAAGAWDDAARKTLAAAFVRDEYPTGRRRGSALDRLAEMRRSLERSRLLYLKAASLLDRGETDPVPASMAKLHAPPVSLRAVGLAMDILGDAGILRDRLLEKLYRGVKALDIVEGTQQVQRLIVARRLIGLPSGT